MRTFEEVFSEAYEAIFPARPSQQALLARLADRLPVTRWLEVGCATGKHARFLAARGMRVTAMDADPSMIRLAQQAARREDLRIDFRVADMSDPGAYHGFAGRFGGASCLGNSLAYAIRPGSLDAVVLYMGRSLAPGGVLLVQTVNFDNPGSLHSFPPLAVPSAGLVFHRRYRKRDDGLIDFELELVPEGGGSSWRAGHVIRPVTMTDLEQAVEGAGLRMTSRSGDFDQRPWTPLAPASILLATR
jgi:SAM-dependent methyltransferase